MKKRFKKVRERGRQIKRKMNQLILFFSIFSNSFRLCTSYDSVKMDNKSFFCYF